MIDSVKWLEIKSKKNGMHSSNENDDNSKEKDLVSEQKNTTPSLCTEEKWYIGPFLENKQRSVLDDSAQWMEIGSKKNEMHSNNERDDDSKEHDLVSEQEKTTTSLSIETEYKGSNIPVKSTEDKKKKNSNRTPVTLMLAMSLMILIMAMRNARTAFRLFGVIPYVFAGLLIAGAILIWQKNK